MSKKEKEVTDLEKAEMLTKVLYGAKKKVVSNDLQKTRMDFDKNK